ncbi:PepSY domain-containing protein [Colwellia sp. D2M02]|uniref:PepSY-associated TM helix domain-containing protein n=1 Tax=Colwellia sp. D2M02 TaxID=2841562 RepID=UPI001C09AD32|nr:PepSY-associated TM helix domain-containing protein [Colwellia sp. D2M02]MBU2891983.1 PepSY domain-containing protein [Colwellia sp. D2M02]
MNKESLKALTNAHAWVGLIISTVLFIVFFAGSLSLFLQDIGAWEKNPHFTTGSYQNEFPLDKTVAKVSENYKIHTHGYFILSMPTKEQPIANLYFEEELPEEKHLDKHLLLSSDGKVLGDGAGFNWANFLYTLHYDLHIPTVGLYFVGIVTLFFFVALLSGVVIHWRKIINKFFQYRHEGKKDKLLDAHNLIGVMGLPFHLMYAFSGLVFNLLIIYQISYAVVLYGGDQGKLFEAAGIVDVHLDETNVQVPVVGLDNLLVKAKESLGEVTLARVSIDHFGDESASVTFRGMDESQFSTKKEVTYHIASGRELYLTTDNYDNDLRGGLEVITSLHFGNFAGYALRVLFFILGIGTCYIILTGNLMWLQKKTSLRKEKQNPLGLRLVYAMTTGGFIGTIFATAVGFICARVIAIDYVGRSDIISYIFFLCLFSAIALSLLLSSGLATQKRFAAIFLKITAILLATTPILDWLFVAQGITTMIELGYYSVLVVEVMLLSLALCCWLIATKLFLAKAPLIAIQTQDEQTNAIKATAY